LDDWLLSHRKEGDSLTIFLPSAYAFEDQGYASVPPNTPIVYTVKYEDILLLSEDLQKIDQYIEDKSWTSTIEPSYGTRVVVHEAGDPDVEVNFGDFISVRYEGRLLDDTVFDSNFDDPSALNFTLGGSDFTPVAGFEMGLNELNEKDSATFFIPSIYGYGEDGNQSAEIPGNAPLAFTIKVENVTKSQQ
jgi:FKBP-type peptidyl-prolyl cis-trans isomerase